MQLKQPICFHSVLLAQARPTMSCICIVYCKNKLVVLTTEWLHWLLSAGEMVVMRGLLSCLRLIAKGKQKTNCPDVMHKQSPVPVHLTTTNTPTTFRTSVRRVITNAYFKVAVRNCKQVIPSQMLVVTVNSVR